MAFLQCEFHSDVLGKACAMNVVLPQKSHTQIGMDSAEKRSAYPVLYLLHGYSDDHSIWSRRTSVERYAAALPLVLVMPAAEWSYYTDMADGYAYGKFFGEELPRLVQEFFPVSTQREDTFVAGLSMGGYGAVKLALTHPETFSYAASLSGVLDIAASKTLPGSADSRRFESIFGRGRTPGDLRGTQDDLLELAEKLVRSGKKLPKLFQCCGTSDGLYSQNQSFRSKIESLGAFDYEYLEGPGTHCWDFWDLHIQDVLKRIPWNAPVK